MHRQLAFLAFDLGAASGRAMLGRFDGERLVLSEVHRFPNGPVAVPDGDGAGYRLHWDALRLWAEIKVGIAKAVDEHGVELAGVGLDTWGVDFGLLDRNGALLANPHHYRDSRTDGMLDEAFGRMGRAEIFEQTGTQFMQINSLYQLLSMVVTESPLLDIAETFLMMPDLFNYLLTGRKVCEFCIATTSQCYNMRKGDWAGPLLGRMGIPTHIFPQVISPGTVIGELLPVVAGEVGVGKLTVIAPGCHDTALAVAAVPAKAEAGRSDFAYISSGTWSLLGAELAEPIVDEQSLAFDVTNEGGVGGTVRFLKNVTGLWLVQECRRIWAQEGEHLSWDALTRMAAEAEPLRSVVDPDYGEFGKPGDMPSRIRAFCTRMGQPVPQTKGEIVRCVLESLALKYRWVLEHLEELLGRRLEPVHIVGGGAQNKLLNQFAADAMGRLVVTGPIEATAAGSIIMQAITLGHIGSVEEGRRIVRRSFGVETYEPQGGAEWEDAYARLLTVIR